MAILKVNPTRINLLGLKRKLKTAEKGYKLLKDKRDGLMRHFMEIIHETRELRMQADRELREAFQSYVRAAALIAPKLMRTSFMLPGAAATVGVETRSVMSVKLPRFSFVKTGSPIAYGFIETTGDLDTAVTQLDAVLPKLVRLAELEQTIENLAFEIERTRRRCSALENNRIPNLTDTIRAINLRLEERERDAVVSALRIKDMITSSAERN